MFEDVVEYMKKHWPSQVREEWQVPLAAYPEIAQKCLMDLTADATKNAEFVRIAGQSGSGKTSQLLPAVEAYFGKKGRRPILVAARRFVEYHPFVEEIRNEYGEENLRKNTDEFATIMMFLVLCELIKQKYDVILDVTLLDPKMEAILGKMLAAQKYDFWMTMVAVSPVVASRFLGARAWRHTKETEQEFVRATKLALDFYAQNYPKMRVVAWNVWDKEPIFDGECDKFGEVWQKYSEITEIPEHDFEELKLAKITYLAK